ncbi:MAG TPA: UDP-4-amino-4,6-dideoxy-N-acetyl-beta-L-altrosamine transaminase [Micropepsaceae bacterium]|jgi:UDP-4-amino-4,6-dideoxy-N-acetyl-beta-L-altrosamine transaminase
MSRTSAAAPAFAASEYSASPASVHRFLPYGRQCIEDDDIEAVTAALRGEYLTTGPLVERFEQHLASATGARAAVACSNGTSALYLAGRALGLGKGHTAVVPAITFLATASAPHLLGADIVFSDVDPESGLMRARDLESALARCPGGRADAIFPVHYAGQSCDMGAIADLARARGAKIVEDAAHALGTAWIGDDGALVPVGANNWCDLTIFSFHPVKTIAMGEGGAVTANDPELIARLKQGRNHGITRDPGQFIRADAAFDANGAPHPWYYELEAPSFNFRTCDINCALGISQLAKLRRFVETRRALVAAYDSLLSPFAPLVRPLKRDPRSSTAWHIYPMRVDFAKLGLSRADVMRALTRDDIGTQVHYIPVHRQPYYAARYGIPDLPGADAYYAATLSLPLFPAMTGDDAARVVAALKHHLKL